MIVLAGGKGSRFNSSSKNPVDKLMVRINNKPMIFWVLEKVSGLFEEVILSTSSARAKAYRELIGSRDIKIVIDKPIGCDGPLLGIASSSRYLEGEVTLIIPGDMPFINPESLVRMVFLLGEHDVLVPLWRNGLTENLLFSAKSSYLREISYYLCSKGYWGPSGIIRASSDSYLVSLEKIFQDPIELVNINTYEDLANPRLREIQGEGDIVLKRYLPAISDSGDVRDLTRELENRDNLFLLALAYYSLGVRGNDDALLRSAEIFGIEGEFYLERGIHGLASLAYKDAGIVLENSKYASISEKYYEKSRSILRVLNLTPGKH